MHRDNAAVQAHRVTQLFKRGVGGFPDEGVELLHLRVVECRWIVSAR